MKKASNEFEPFLNECQTYVWEWYIPEHKVRFGIPSLNRLWIDDKEKNIKLSTMLERVHPDDIQKVLVKKTSPLFRSEKMFEVDLRLNVADELMPDGTQASGKYEWYGFRGKTIRRDAKGQPTYVRGVAINLDQRYRAQMKLIAQKEHQLQSERQQNEYCMGVMQEVYSFMRGLAENATKLIPVDPEDKSKVLKINDLKTQAEHILSLADRYRSFAEARNEMEDEDIKPLFMWEHLAELQQVYSLKTNTLKIYFSNLYDNQTIYVNQNLLDVLIDNILNIEHRNKIGGCVTMSYTTDLGKEQLHLNIACTNSPAEGGLGLSVCRILAKRLWGDVSFRCMDGDKMEYVITLPIDARKQSQPVIPEEEKDTLDELQDEEPAERLQRPPKAALPLVLIGISDDEGLFERQHLFDALICTSTDELLETYKKANPDMVFVDTSLTGFTSVAQAIASMHQLHADTPIIVTDDEAQRPLHKQLCQLGAQYMLTNPLTQRKVNMMVRRYLK